MDQFQFNEYGLLRPYSVINSDLASIEQFFVDSFPLSSNRRRLFNHFLRYLNNFQIRISREFVLWIGGSFVTLKENPNDLDFVVFLNHETYDVQQAFLESFWTFSLEDQKLDAYIVKIFPESHPLHYQTVRDQARWTKLYGTTKLAESLDSRSKGFLTVTFS